MTKGRRVGSTLRLSVLSIIFFIICLTSQLGAEVTLPRLLADHMVLQRGRPVHVWGMASPGEKVSAAFRGETKSAVADELGRWSLYFAPGEAGGPFEMTVQGTNLLVLRDILVGDVWVASGQSNMEFPLWKARNADAEIAAANYPRIRVFHVERKWSDYPLDDVEAKPWTLCTPEAAHDFSALAYFFARDVQKKTGVPIGIVEAYWGGTPAEAWTSLRAMSADASLMPVFAARANLVENEAANRLQIKLEEAREQQAIAAGFPPPERPWHPILESWEPAALYNAMISPLTRYAIKGVIWYQGESNDKPDRIPTYARLFQTLITSWRSAWGVGDFPFLFVQIANWDDPRGSLWPEVREAQRKALSLQNTAMVVVIDGEEATDLHPTNKQDVGARLALAARAVAYGEQVEYSGPLIRQVTREGTLLRAWFDHAARGLVTKGGTLLKGFEVAGADGKFVPAEATIEASTVLVSSPAVASPVFVRYGWAANPDGNLYNREGLPASPFSSQ